ncbi:hypothetical protein Fbal_3226 [Ferrimonas balearica DSM 9799]|uniref:Uncharacterized protein n=1 Tax=Ferrimonas balearica (strain DSM 9799 / CCM 4581 / KCTC 23876 / PAT) TaxID=550540 RepID=E1SVX4_FERBD|nr:hypothetical protein [Ferrimonas balearica]MBY6017941.1 hypothetical protein [Halomonas denitrificans]ADN77425.1 hypothetical protein Fbal_3226 [Ferrimonas balearica DSM 9799]MBW3139575.1 hypothetical protein [Ferrimonas balearica]MBW3164612.1 hypothetical protein [Ferrimonas balearica]MBY5980526.1 hypothetical protein [Ferrimonas balearica]
MTELERGDTSPLACLRPYVLVNPGAGNKVKKRIWELTLEECRTRARVFETSDGDDHRILTLKLGKKVLSLEQIAPQCSRLRVPRHQAQQMTNKLLEAVRKGALDDALLDAQRAQRRSQA